MFRIPCFYSFGMGLGLVLLVVGPMPTDLRADCVVAASNGKVKKLDPRENLQSALRFYVELLKKKDADKFIDTALMPSRRAAYRRQPHYDSLIKALNGPRWDVEIEFLKAAMKLEPRRRVSSINEAHERATYEWKDPKYGRVIVDLTKEDGIWYLNW